MKSIILLVVLLLSVSIYSEAEHGWNSPASVSREIIKAFKNLKTYQANFTISTTRGKKTKVMSGKCYYKSGGKMRFDFNKPYGDVIVSNGKKLWIYIKKLNAVGIQSLTLNKKHHGKPLFMATSATGIERMFKKYHYKFDQIKQPRVIDSKRYFILDLTQMVKVGGFSKIKLFVDADNYFIKKAIASNEFGLTSTIKFTNIKKNILIEDGRFKFTTPGSAKIVQNPLIKE